MSDELAIEAFGEWFERVDDRLETAESEIQSNQRSLKRMGEDMGDLACDLDDVEDDLAALEAKLENHKRAEFVDSVVSSFGENDAVVTDFKLKDTDGAFLQGGGVELTIHAQVKGGSDE